MSQNVAPIVGQIDVPSRLEVFWEHNKRIVYLGLAAAAAAIGLNYAWQYKKARDRSQAWSAFAVASKLDEGYSAPGSLWPMIQDYFGQSPQNAGRYVEMYYGMAQRALVAELSADIKLADETTLKSLAAASDARAPMALWLLANQALTRSDFDSATSRLGELTQRFPKHFLCVESVFPVQWRPAVKVPVAEANDPPSAKPKQKVEFEPVHEGSLVGLKLQQIAADRGFRELHPEFYLAPEPDSAETVVFELEGGGTIGFKLYASRAPKHVSRILDLAKSGWWVGMRVHLVERAASGLTDTANAPSHFAIGWPTTKDDDRAKWKETDVEVDNLLDLELANISCFGGMVSVEAAKEGKSQVERLSFNLEDEAIAADGNRLVVGRVVSGLEVVREIVNAEFADDAGAKSGRGRPLEGFKVTAVRVE